MQHQWINLIYIPFVTGLVGYLTNKLAIKMLFRPFEPKWYTLGWQGIVPKTRPALAKKIGEAVSRKLIAHEDLTSVISTSEFKIFLQNIISSKLAKMDEEYIENLISGINIGEIVSKNSENLDKAGRAFIETLLKKPFSELINIKAIKEKASGTVPEISLALASETAGILNNLIYSGKSLEGTLPAPVLDKLDSLVEYLAEVTAGIIKTLGKSLAVKEAAAEKIIEFKNSFFGSGGSDAFKMGLLNMFLDDETIANAIKRELPTVMDGIADNENVRENIKSSIKDEITKLLNLKLSELADKAGQDFIPSLNAEISTYFASTKTQDIVKTFINGYATKIVDEYSTLTCGDALEKAGVNLAPAISEFKLSDFLKKLCDEEHTKKISYSVAGYIHKNNYDIARPVTEGIISFLQTNMALIVESVNIEKTVEDKIKKLSLIEVEDLLFSFMRVHFKWINILGFIIGFFIGILQLVITELI